MSDTPLPGFTLRHTLRGRTGQIGRIAWSPDGRMLASPLRDGAIQLWDAASGVIRLRDNRMGSSA